MAPSAHSRCVTKKLENGSPELHIMLWTENEDTFIFLGTGPRTLFQYNIAHAKHGSISKASLIHSVTSARFTPKPDKSEGISCLVAIKMILNFHIYTQFDDPSKTMPILFGYLL